MLQNLDAAHVSRRERSGLTLPPKTSSPIIKHPAVCINLFWGEDIVSRLDDVIIDGDEVKAAADRCA